MSMLNAEQKTIELFMGDKRVVFLIPDYQRPYVWGEEECTQLWDDIFSFAFPDEAEFNEDDDYFLGSLVLFRNEDCKLEVIDGQQRLITITLLLRAFHKFYESITSQCFHDVKRDIEKCLWKVSKGVSQLKIHSEVATDDDIKEFEQIMHAGITTKHSHSLYAQNYILFQNKISDLDNSHLSSFPARILANCSMLPLMAEGQNTALRIFSTLNDRGKPLSDSDIFKAKLYKAYSADNRKEDFMSQWKNFEAMCSVIPFSGKTTSIIDDMFNRYMYYIRAREEITGTKQGIRDFYTRDDSKFSLLRRDYYKTFCDLQVLAEFWKDIAIQDQERFSCRVLKQLYVMSYIPTNTWTFVVSVYFMANRDARGKLNEQKFYVFLQKVTGFILASSILQKSQKYILESELITIAQGADIKFSNYLFDVDELRTKMHSFDFSDNKKITRAMVAWYMFQDMEQKLLAMDLCLNIEHIYPKARAKRETLIDINSLEAIGNKSLLERTINIRASDFRFQDKKKYYLGKVSGKTETKVHELRELAETHNDFTEQDIKTRTIVIIDSFISFVKDCDLTK